ncbi:MAG TPA: AsmA family protein, partial [Alphaproteobacteria bacterium]|nr:AsmA family protein [Alphaproteobacteria bacterium]
MLRKILIGLLAVVVVLVAAAFLAPMFIPKDWIRDRITAQVRQATGRELTIAGDLDLQLLPTARVNAHEVTFSNQEIGSRAEMMTLQELRVHVALLPLLSSELDVNEFVLVEPDVLLEVNENGKANWVFDAAGQAESAAAPPAEQANGQAGSPLAGLQLGDVRVVDGQITYRDAQTGTVETVKDVNVTVSLPNLDSPLGVDGRFAWNGETLELNLGAEQPRALAEGDVSPVSFSLKGDPLSLNYKGRLDTGALEAGGALDLDVPSVRRLAEWTGSPLDLQGDQAFGPLKLDGELAADPSKISFTSMTLVLDEINADGEMAAALAGAVPSITGKLNVAALNLNPYLEAFGGAPAAANGGGQQQEGQQQATGWSDEPLDLSPLRQLNAELTLNTGLLQVQDIKIDESALAVTLNGGKLSLDLRKLALYDGSGTAQIDVDASGEIPSIGHSMKLSGVQARPLLTDAAEIDWLSGTANMEMDVTTRGTSQKAMVNALDGNGNFAFRDGSLYGINIAAIIRDPASAVLKRETEERKTDFAELSGSFTANDGVVSNDDLQLLSPLLRLTGAGTVNLPPRTLKYRIEPKAVASLKGQGGEGEKAGVLIPVIIQGPWDNLKIRPDLKGAAGEALKDPSKILESEKPAEALKKLIPGIGGGSDGGSEG